MVTMIFLLLLALFLLQAEISNAICTRTQGVTFGDSCWSISIRVGLSLTDLLSLNPNVNCGLLMPGQQLCVAATQSTTQNGLSPTAVTCTSNYFVVLGDSCWGIAQKAAILLTELQNLNPDINCGFITPGQQLCLKKGPADNNPIQTPPIQPTIPAASLVQNINCAVLIPGQQLCVRASQSVNSGGTFLDPINPAQPRPEVPSIPSNPTNGNTGDSGGISSVPDPICGKLQVSVGFVTSWSIWRRCMRVVPENIDASAYTHIHFSFAGIDSNHRLIINNQDDANYLRQLVTHINARYPTVEIIIAVGGWTFNDPGPTQLRFTNMVSTSANRQTFINSAISLLQQYRVHGIDIDWEYPTVASRGGRPDDADNLNRLMSEMRAAFGRRYFLSISIPAGISSSINGFKLAGLVPFVDYIVSMTYDMRGSFSFSERTGGQLLAHNNITDVQQSITRTIQLGVPANKLLLGLSFYGRSYRQRDANCSNPGCPFVNPAISQADPGPCTGESGFISYSEVADIIARRQFRINRFDARSLTNIITYGQNQWATYDSPETIRRRMTYAKQQCLAGTAVWAVDLDRSNFELSSTIRQSRL